MPGAACCSLYALYYTRRSRFFLALQSIHFFCRGKGEQIAWVQGAFIWLCMGVVHQGVMEIILDKKQNFILIKKKLPIHLACTQHNIVRPASHQTTLSHHTAPPAHVTHNPVPCPHTNHVGNPVANQTHQHTPSHLSPWAHPRHLLFPPLSPATPHHGNKTGCYMFVPTYGVGTRDYADGRIPRCKPGYINCFDV